MAKAYYFVGFNKKESIKVVFETREKVFLASSLTKNKLQDVSKKFYDNDYEKEKCLKLDDNLFHYYVISQFARLGYKYIKNQNE